MYDDTLDIHIRAAVRPGAETQRLLEDLVDACWPGGTDDAVDPITRGWLRHYPALVPITGLPGCTCGGGHCPICN